MSLRPHPLSRSHLDTEELKSDRKNCQKIGPCGIGKKALYLSSFYIDRYYYVPIKNVTRAFKRVAMSKGGFSGKGTFVSLSYLVVEYDNGRQKQCIFKHEKQVDDFLKALSEEQPQIELVSRSAQEKLAREKKEQEKEQLSRPELTSEGRKATESLQRAIDYLEQKPEYSENLSKAAQRRRAYQCASPSARWVAMALTILGFFAVAFGIYSFTRHSGFAIYFVLFGIAAIFTFAGFSVLPTARNNRRSIMNYDERSRQQMEEYIRGYAHFPVPARYAHPVVLRRMQRVIEQGRASGIEQALEIVKEDLKALNSSVQVSQKEYDEVVAIKPMFLNAMYQ